MTTPRERLDALDRKCAAEGLNAQEDAEARQLMVLSDAREARP